MFSHIIGHTQLLAGFKHKAPHGVILLAGPPSIGKYKIADRLANYAICSGTKNDTCRCPVCRGWPDNPDLMLIGVDPSESIKGEDTSGVEDFILLESYKSGQKVLLLRDAERMTSAAAEHLLKTLERDGDHLIILTTSELESVPKTIISRCSIYSLEPLSGAEVLEVIKSEGHTGTRYIELAKASRRLLGSLMRDPVGYADQRDKAVRLLKAYSHLDEVKFLDSMMKVTRGLRSDQAVELAEMLILLLNDITKIRLGCIEMVVNESKIKLLEDLGVFWGEPMTFPIIEQLKLLVMDECNLLHMDAAHTLKQSLVVGFHVLTQHKELA